MLCTYDVRVPLVRISRSLLVVSSTKLGSFQSPPPPRNVICRAVQILCLLTFVVRYQLTLQCKISNNKSKSKGTANLWSNVHGPTISSWCACLHVAVSVGVVVSQLLVDLVDEVVHLDSVVVIVLGWGPHINDVSRAERGMGGSEGGGGPISDQRKGGCVILGGQKPENLADVIYVWPLPCVPRSSSAST